MKNRLILFAIDPEFIFIQDQFFRAVINHFHFHL
jgi:hypothetical protein